MTSRSRCCATPRRRRHGSSRPAGTRRDSRAWTCRGRSSPRRTRRALAEATDLVIFATPSAHLRGTVAARRAVPRPVGGHRVRGQGPRARQPAPDERGHRRGRRPSRRIGSPPCPARTWPPRSPAGCPRRPSWRATDPALAERVVARLSRRRFRLYVNQDILGVELAGALKNVVAIAAGAAGRPRLRRQRQGRAADARPRRDDAAGDRRRRQPADVRRARRDRRPHRHLRLAACRATTGSAMELAKGRSWAEIEADLPGTAEGAYTVQAALALADRLGVEMPIAREVQRALFEGKSVKRCLVDLLARESKDELADASAWIASLGGTRAR